MPGSVPCHARHTAVLPCLCHGCSTQAVGLAGFLPSCPWPLQGTVGPMGTSTLRAHRRASSARELSRNGSSQGCWRLIPRQIYHWGSQGADSPCSGANLQRSRQGQQPQQGQARHEGCSHEQAAAAPGSVTKATARAHIWCFLGCSVLITLHIPPRREEMTALGDKGSASELQMETQMVACPGSTGGWHKGNQRGGPMRVFVAWTSTLPA